MIKFRINIIRLKKAQHKPVANCFLGGKLFIDNSLSFLMCCCNYKEEIDCGYLF